MPRNDRSRLAVELQQEMERFTDGQAIGLEEYIEQIPASMLIIRACYT